MWRDNVCPALGRIRAMCWTHHWHYCGTDMWPRQLAVAIWFPFPATSARWRRRHRMWSWSDGSHADLLVATAAHRGYHCAIRPCRQDVSCHVPKRPERVSPSELSCRVPGTQWSIRSYWISLDRTSNHPQLTSVSDALVRFMVTLLALDMKAVTSIFSPGT